MPKTSVRDWFSTHMNFTDKTKLFDQLTAEERESCLAKLATQIPEEKILVSSFDDENFMLLTKERIYWIYDGKRDEASISRILEFGRDGGLSERDNIIRLSSPIVYLKLLGGEYKTFKIEPGHTIDTIQVGLDKLMKESQRDIIGGLIRSTLLSSIALIAIISGLIYFGFWHWQYVQFPQVVKQLNQLSDLGKKAR